MYLTQYHVLNRARLADSPWRRRDGGSKRSRTASWTSFVALACRANTCPSWRAPRRPSSPFRAHASASSDTLNTCQSQHLCSSFPSPSPTLHIKHALSISAVTEATRPRGTREKRELCSKLCYKLAESCPPWRCQRLPHAVSTHCHRHTAITVTVHVCDRDNLRQTSIRTQAESHTRQLGAGGGSAQQRVEGENDPNAPLARMSTAASTNVRIKTVFF